MIQEKLKVALTENPGEVFVQQFFPDQFQQVLTEQKEWNSNKHLSILYVLLHAQVPQEQRKYSNLPYSSWENQWKPDLLNLKRDEKRFGYRVRIFLGCDFVDDLDAQIAINVFNHLIQCFSHSSKCFNRNIIQDLIFDKIISYSQPY
jgi:hypothetical protein